MSVGSPVSRAHRVYFIAFDVPPEVHRYHSVIQAELRSFPGGEMWMRQIVPHITVKESFAVPVLQEEGMRRIIMELVRKRIVRKFEVEFGDIEVFPKNRAIYLAVKGGSILPQMLHIIRSLDEVGFLRGPYEGWVPHITLAKPRAQKANLERIVKIIKEIDGRPCGTSHIQRLCIYKGHEGGGRGWESVEPLILS